MADRFFNRLRIDGQAALDLIFDSPKLDADRINWTNLTFLTIRGDINIETISALLPRLPSLTNLKACDLVHSEDTNNTDALDQSTPPDLASLSTTAPLSTSVRSIKLTYNGGDYICGSMEDGVVQLILRVPSLTFLFVDPDFGECFGLLKENDIDFFDVSQDY
ncbi:hypothetical protein BX661DRAFT_180514 [Kickxella alabastrina]|uniref:uncharacterized protein n=1 Tax=Kickxella alabastrina TaxID=61397 RepID=UPI00221FDBCB|nr:uncharacterized protein BX661DRAFT_180514 [Kickxella alabastrina]KAI7831027.1 hypothetical protein BX661DRAFT_180514 [Kickxella alabastrina]